MSEELSGFANLVLRAEQGIDYELIVRDLHARATVIALHGGPIEPLTGELASAIAGDEWNLYLLQCLRAERADELRLSHLRLQEMRCDRLLAQSDLALAIDGTASGEAISVGGANETLVVALQQELAAAGFAVAAIEGRLERLSLQCYNRARHGGAVLLLPLALRCSLVESGCLPGTPRSELCPTPRWATLVDAIRTALARSVRATGVDLTVSLSRFEQATRDIQQSGLLQRPPGQKEP